MNAILTEPESAARSSARRENLTLPDGASEFGMSAVEPQSRILYVDDDPQIRQLGELLLVRSGYAVHTAADGAEAWAALQESSYDLLVTDNQMPRLSGLDLIRKIQTAQMAMPVILASGTVGMLRLDDFPWLKCAAMLLKPFTHEQLLSAVRRALLASRNVRTPTGTRLPEQTKSMSTLNRTKDVVSTSGSTTKALR